MEQSMNDPRLLDKIDRLFACGVGEYVALPTIVVVGHQSSGKSSVLEALTNLPFPRDSGLCTRFATQITFRRSAEASISVSIIPRKDASAVHRDEVQNWTTKDIKELNQELFHGIMQEVHARMGLGSQDSAGGNGTFSEDVLRLDVSGPDQEHFSVVDVPGIFRKTTEGVTTKADMAMVEALTRKFMENPRSVMLTVVPANVDVATQEIMTMAEEVDAAGTRTLGVLTKPDLVDKGAEKQVMELVQGTRHKLNLGWFMVRNPSQQQLEQGGSRDEIESTFFKTEKPWNTLDSNKVGVAALRVRLQEILASNIRREFPKVKMEINKKLAATRKELAFLGDERRTPLEQSQYLLKISMQFQRIVESAMNVKYVDHDCFDEYPSLRFVTLVANRNDLFANTLESYGHSYEFQNSNETQESEHGKSNGPSNAVANKPPAKAVSHSTSKNSPHSAPPPTQTTPAKTSETTVKLRLTDDHPDLEELMPSQTGKSMAKIVNKDTFKWLTEVYEASRGFELGTFDSSLLATTMKTQSSKWEELALTYISDVMNMAHSFISDLLNLLCPNMRTRLGLMSALMDELITKYKAAFESVRFLLYVERKTTPFTVNHYFNENLQKCRQDRMRANVSKRAFSDVDFRWVVRVDDVMHTQSMSNTNHVVREIHDILFAYYKVARKRFVDNICMQASDYYLVTGPATPLKLFSPSFVSSLSEEQLEEIAGEDVTMKRMRRDFLKQIADLEAGKQILK